MADPTSSSSSSPAASITFALKWRSDAFDVTLPLNSTVLDLKKAVEQRTSVPAASVKVLGLKLLGPGPPRPPVDSDPLSALAPPKAGGGGPRLMVMGTPAAAAAALVAAATEAAAEAAAGGTGGGGGLLDEDDAADAAAAAAAQQLLDDEDDPSAIASDPDNRAKLARRISAFELKLRETPRPGARGALVLDIDYTIFDLGSAAERPELLARPHLHEFLSASYAAGFDLFIWSANSMKWIEVKMRELG